MAHISKKPIIIPPGVEVFFDDNSVKVKGPNGTVTVPVLPFVKIEKSDDGIRITGKDTPVQARANRGTMYSLLINAVYGVVNEYVKTLEIEGVGFRADMKGNALSLNVGFSHPVEVAIPDGVTVSVDKNSVITVKGADKNLVGETAARIRAIKKPEPYKGKGIRYQGEVILRKAGKKAATSQ